MWTVTKEFRFEGAHSLPHLPPEHKCHHLHGHSYRVAIECQGDLIPDKSWVIDYADIAAAVEPLIEALDHKDINDVILIPSTAENIAYWIWAKLHHVIPVAAVHVYETPTTCATYRPR
jgi:6-pyruvoyltetrahydropterin/6-carboxytetrahydropterin synthase